MRKIRSSRSWLAQKSRRLRSLNASIFVAKKYGAVTTLISQIPNQLGRGRGFHSGTIRAIGESENLFIQGHNVEDCSRMNPAAQRCSFAGIFGESERANAFAECGVLRI